MNHNIVIEKPKFNFFIGTEMQNSVTQAYASKKTIVFPPSTTTTQS